MLIALVPALLYFIVYIFNIDIMVKGALYCPVMDFYWVFNLKINKYDWIENVFLFSSMICNCQEINTDQFLGFV